MNLATTSNRVLRISCFALGCLTLIGATTLPLCGQRLAQQIQAQQAQANQQQAPAEDAELSADEIIQILRENPDVLADAKAEIVAQLRDRGYPITERELSDERLFNEIRSDERARKAMSDQLKSRGFTGGGETEMQPQQPAPAATRPASPAPSAQPGGAGAGGQQQQPGMAHRNRTSGQSDYPLRNLPALHDLYTQALNAPVTLERFGAALFRVELNRSAFLENVRAITRKF